MPSFLEHYDAYYGDGTVNEKGETLDEFLNAYDASGYESPFVTADILVFRPGKVGNTGLQLLMIQRKNHPCIGWWALPGGFAEMKEDIMATAKRELEEETGLTEVPMEQLYVWGEQNRDPRARILTVSFLAYLSQDKKIEAGDDAKDAAWVDVDLQKVSTEIQSKGDGILRRIEEYQLTLSNVEKGIENGAIVCIEQNINTVVKELRYCIKSNEKIAFDHARIILQALDYLQK